MAEHVYDPIAVEKKWQEWWDANGINEIDLAKAPNPYYVLMMFPYPSAEGLHVGNVYAFTGADVYGRHMRLRGYDVFEPIGFDAFGMHSEMFAQKVGRHPADLVPSSVRNFTRQLRMMGFMFDWRRTVDTTTPEYYKWTQWVFLQLYKAGLVYRDVKEVNFAPSIGSVISDEQVMPDGTFERDGTPVERRQLPCWFFRITEFADRLLDNHEWLDWSETTKKKQIEWIGRSEGAEVDFAVVPRTAGSAARDAEPSPWTADEDPDAIVREREMAQAAGLELVDLDTRSVDESVARRISRDTALSYRVLPLEEEEGVVTLATSNPLLVPALRQAWNVYTKARHGRGVAELFPGWAADAESLRERLGARELRFAWSGDSQLRAAIDRLKLQHRIRVYTTRPDTLFGATYMVLSPEHPLVDVIAAPEKREEIARYRAEAAAKSTEERTAAEKEKTGVDIGARALNPVNGEEIPVYISDYVLMGYGTGAIMAVPAHDERDFAFATKFGLPIRAVINPDPRALAALDAIGEDQKDRKSPEEMRAAVLQGQLCWSGPGKGINSANDEVSLDGLEVDEAKARITRWLEEKGLGVYKRTYRLRDWGISRQRYWGPPVPIVYDEHGEPHPVPEDQLPVLLPETDDLVAPGDGRGPLAKCADWVHVEIDGKSFRRETDVMDNFLDSAWYFLRYVSATDPDRAYDPDLIRKWLPVDMYIGGNEHAVLHLMYTRFVCMGLDKAGALGMGARDEMKDRAEPFRRFRAHGLITKDGAKMSKSKGNIVNPDAYVEEWGADTLRMYLLFLGPYTQGGDFRDKDIQGIRRFLNRLHQWYMDKDQPVVPDGELPKDLRVKTHQTLKKVRECMESLSYNTAISGLMELFNVARGAGATSEFVREVLLLGLAPFAPHFAEEIWREALGRDGSVWTHGSLPEYDPALTVADEVEIVLQLKGKIKDRVVVPREAGEEELRAVALANARIQEALAGGEPRKVIVVPGRLVNVIA